MYFIGIRTRAGASAKRSCLKFDVDGLVEFRTCTSVSVFEFSANKCARVCVRVRSESVGAERESRGESESKRAPSSSIVLSVDPGEYSVFIGHTGFHRPAKSYTLCFRIDWYDLFRFVCNDLYITMYANHAPTNYLSDLIFVYLYYISS